MKTFELTLHTKSTSERIKFEERLDRRRLLGNFRQLKRPSLDLIDFASNDYLGIAKSPKFKNAYLKNIKKFTQLGATGSRLLTGNTIEAEELEHKIANFHGYEAGLIFTSGYMANNGLLPAITIDLDVVLYDSQIHASTHDGIKLSKAKSFPFKHNDLNHLEERLKKRKGYNSCFICIESIYSTDGSQAPLKEIANLAESYGAHVIIDEAHSTGIFGPHGKGLIAELGLTSKVFAQIITFGKALGVSGAIILGSNLLRTYLINFAHTFIYTTGLPSLILSAIDLSYSFFPEMDLERNFLRKLIDQFTQQLNTSSMSPIQSINIPGNKQVQDASEELQKNGFDVRALKSPTVARGKECLRVCLHSYNNMSEVNSLIDILKTYQ